MLSGLPVNLDDLLSLRGFEENRVEFKESLNDVTGPAVIETMCAFANDLLNLNGGYLVIGVAEERGRAVLPPRGVPDVDSAQKKIFALAHRIQPAYQHIPYLERYQGRDLLVVFCPGGDNRPYQARPRERDGGEYFVRTGSITSKARGDVLRQLLGQTAKIPFDDRSCLLANVLELSPHLVRQHLLAVGSALAEASVEDRALMRQLLLVRPVNGHEAPRNVAVLFFHAEPLRYFPGARIDLVRFADGAGGQVLLERTFAGPLPEQIRSCLTAMEGLNGKLVRKVSDQPEAQTSRAYPPDALREALVNATYHRGYDGTREPTKVYVYPDRVEIISYPGPHPAIQPEHLQPGGTIPPGLPARNRRIGEFLKELRLAEARGTGIPKIRRTLSKNGSPPPEFHFHPGEEDGYFATVIPIQAEHARDDAARLWGHGQHEEAVWLLRRAAARQPGDGALVKEMCWYSFRSGALEDARAVLASYLKTRPVSALPVIRFVRLLLGREFEDEGGLQQPLEPMDPERVREARDWLSAVPAPEDLGERIELAVLFGMTGAPEVAYDRLRAELDRGEREPRVLYRLGVTAMALADEHAGDLRQQLLLEATDLFEEAIAMAPGELERWCWLRLARVLAQLPVPRSEVKRADLRARELFVTDPALREEYQRPAKSAR